MIPQINIIEWRSKVSWPTDAQVEQDLIVSRAIISIFSNDLLRQELAFRGGTALHKLFFDPPARYSEDIDLVQVRANPIGPILTALREVLNPWLGKPSRSINEGRCTWIYRFKSTIEPIVNLRLKVEINTREHFSILGFQNVSFSVKNAWFTGSANVLTYALEELLGTKLRALHQRKKGRDLFDMEMALTHFPNLDHSKVIECFHKYLKHEGKTVSRAQYEVTIDGKMADHGFRNDILPLLKINERNQFQPEIAFEKVKKAFIEKLQGDPWKGKKGNRIF